ALAGLDLSDRFRELRGQGYRHQNQAPFSYLGAAQNVIRLLPGELQRALRIQPSQWEACFEHRPRSRRAETGLGISIFDGKGKSSLQRGLMTAELVYDGGEAAARE